MGRELVYTPRAVADLEEIYRFIAQQSPDRALNFVAGMRRRCRLLLESPELGPLRPKLGKGVRLYPMRRRVVVVYVIRASTIDVLRVFYAGRDYETVMAGSRTD